MPKLNDSGILRTKPISTGKWLGFGGDILNRNGILGKPIQMFGHQQRVYENYSNENNVIIQHPGGSGKSTTIRFVHGRKVHEDNKQKLCIVVPQTLISKSFLPPKDKDGKQIPLQLQYPDGSLIEWDLTNLCEKESNGKTKILKDWLIAPRRNLKGMDEAVIITTYHALVSVWKNLDKREKKKAIKNTIFVMDEAHRILYQDVDENEYDSNETNCIGDMIKFIVNQNNKDTYLWLTTATFIRGDNASILPPDIYDKFKKDYLPLDEHWAENINSIQSFSYDFIVYKINPDEEVETLLKNSIGKKTLFYCPGQGTKHGDKYEFRDRMLKVIRKVWKDAEVLDLIDEEGRDRRKEQFISGEIKPDVVLSVDLFNEGVDWVECEQIIDIVPSNSLTRHLQKNLRLWRDYPGKEHIAHYAFFQFNKKALDEEGYTRTWNEIFALWIASMILDEQLCPINMAALNGEPERRNGNGGVVAPNPFKVLFPDLNKQNEIIGKVGRELIVASNASEEKLSSAEIRECIQRVVEDYIPEEDDEVVENVCRVISAMLNRKSQPTYGVNIGGVVDAGFEKVYRDDFDGIWRYASEACGFGSLEELRKCYGDFKTVDEWVKIAEQLAEENGWDGNLTGGIKGYTDEEIAEMRAEYEAQES